MTDMISTYLLGKLEFKVHTRHFLKQNYAQYSTKQSKVKKSDHT